MSGVRIPPGVLGRAWRDRFAPEGVQVFSLHASGVVRSDRIPPGALESFGFWSGLPQDIARLGTPIAPFAVMAADDGSNVPTRLVESTHMAVKKCRHGTMMYNVNDAFIGRSLDLYGEWCDDEVFILGQILSPGDIVVDVGANIGTHAVFFAKSVTERGLVVAFEPQRLVFQTLCGNIALNGLTNVTCFCAAVGDQRGQITFPTVDPRQAFNFGAVRASSDGKGEVVDVIPIDELTLRRCALIKVDVEGMEAKVIAGAKETIARCRPALFLENDTVERSREVLEAVEAIGYKAFWQVSGYYNPKNFFANSENVFGRFQPQANVFCVPKECPFTGLPPVEGLDDDWRKAVGRLAASQRLGRSAVQP